MKDNNFLTPGFKGNILVIDDEDVVISVAQLVLRQAGYRVESAFDGKEALNLMIKYNQNGKMFDAIIMDLSLPGDLSGKELIDRMLEISPESRVVVSSGESNHPIITKYSEYGLSGKLSKPYRAGDLKAVIGHVISLNKSVQV
ncbi:MAG: response regulator [Candidatus Zixiibacteriota bacterium]